MSIRPTPNSELGQRFPALRTLILGYVIAAADDDDGSPDSAVRDFAADYPERAASAAEAVRFLLTQCPDEAARARELTQLGWPFTVRPGELDALLEWAAEFMDMAGSSATAEH